MPWYAIKSPSECPAAKPWAVKNKVTGRRMGCHPNKVAANDQIAALNINVKEKKMSESESEDAEVQDS